MKITPLDLRKPDFKRTFKGYDVDEVREMLSSAADTLEEVIRENMDLKTRLAEMNERLKNFQNLENTLNETLILAQKAGESARQASQREAEMIVAKAEVEADRMLDAARARLRELKFEIERLDEQRQSYLVKMRSMVASQWKLLQEEFETEQVSRFESVEDEPEAGGTVAAEEQSAPAPSPDEAADEEGMSAEREGQGQGGDSPEGSAFEGERFEQLLEAEAELDRDSVTNLSRKLGEFLRAKSPERGREPEGEALVADEDLEEPVVGGDREENALSWGAEEAGEKPELFWGQEPEDEKDRDSGGKGDRKK